MAILLIAEHDNATLSDQTAKVLSAALQIGSDVHALVAGKGAKGAADAAARLNGVSKVLLAEADELTVRLAEPLAALVISIAGAYDTIIAPATASGKNVAPRPAALLDDAEVSDVISPDTFKRPIYAGTAIQTVQSRPTPEGDHRAHRFASKRLPRQCGCRREYLGGSQPVAFHFHPKEALRN